MKENWLNKERHEFFGLSGNSKKKLKRKAEDDFSPERALKISGGLLTLGVGVSLAKSLLDSS